ncbi:MAG TPA: Rieske 2Fe-2S domain-containing protein [Chloroflexota bacterium]|nr:Rieske 2Fe-2S domain-containing protein [Chloroflexota bacterium]
MLNREDNELVCRVGPGTPMGSLMREYWIPVLQSEDLPQPDSDPLRIRLLGEDLIAFRDTNGAIGLLANNCPHRGASLFFGRNEEAGLRCVYHGWKFDSTGQCVDMPNEPAESDFRTKVKAVAYPCRELNGIVWTYMGPRTTPPPLPELGWSLVPAEQRQSLRYARACNWLQALEGDIDSSHVNYLHRRFDNQDSLSTAPRLYSTTDQDRKHFQLFRDNGTPTLQVVDTEVGVTYGAKRPGEGDHDFWRITQYMLPFYTSIPGTSAMGSAKIWVPLDDEHTMIWEPSWSLTGKALPEEDRRGRTGRVPKAGFLPETSNALSRWIFGENAANDYGIDRQRQKTVNYTGLDESNPLQDGAIQETMGAILDRSIEHLGSADAMIIRVRRKLLETVRAYKDESTLPPGLDQPEAYRRRGVQLTLPNGANWLEATETLVKQVVPA